MRVRFLGYSGERPPVPPSELVEPTDPNPDPPLDPDDPSIPEPLTLVLETGEFHKLDYLAMGYNRFDVMCIGGAGGDGGHRKQIIPDSGSYSQTAPGDMLLAWNSFIHRFGGGGGGGGVHRIKGRLALLPTVVEVVVGAAGADGGYVEGTSTFHDWHSGAIPPGGRGGTDDVLLPPNGADGEASSFGGTICRASGGKGGLGSGVGGAGGVGNAELPGGGAAAGANGTWDGTIGAGGGGGAGSRIDAINGNHPIGRFTDSPGGDGAKSTTEPLTKGPGGHSDPFSLDYTYVQSSYPAGYNELHAGHVDGFLPEGGEGGGAKPFLINGEDVQYGSKADGGPGDGLVIIRLTYVIT